MSVTIAGAVRTLAGALLVVLLVPFAILLLGLPIVLTIRLLIAAVQVFTGGGGGSC